MPFVEVHEVGWECDRCRQVVHQTYAERVPSQFKTPSGWKILCGACVDAAVRERDAMGHERKLDERRCDEWNQAHDRERRLRWAAEKERDDAVRERDEFKAAFSDDVLASAMVAVYPATDVTGLWVAHFTDFNCVTQGRTRAEAIVSLLDAARLMLRHAQPSGRGDVDPPVRGDAG